MRSSARNVARRNGFATGLAGVEHPSRRADRMPHGGTPLYEVWYAAWLKGYMVFHGAEVERILRDTDAPTRAAVVTMCAEYTGSNWPTSYRRGQSWGFFVNLEERSRRFERAADAVNTIRAYASRWKLFVSWCRVRGLSALPVHPDVLRIYIKIRVLERMIDTILPAYANGVREEALELVCDSVDVVPPDRAWMQAGFAAYDRERSRAS